MWPIIGSCRACQQVLFASKDRSGRREWVFPYHQGNLLVDDHVNHPDEPRGVQEGLLAGPPPKGIRYAQVRIVLGTDDIQKGVVEHGDDGVVDHLLLEPAGPVVAVLLDLVLVALKEAHRIVAVAHGDAVLRLHKVGQHLGVGRVVPPRLLDHPVARAVGHVPSHLAPHPAQAQAGVPNPRLARVGRAELVFGEGWGAVQGCCHRRRCRGSVVLLRLAEFVVGVAQLGVLPTVRLLQQLQAPKQTSFPVGAIVFWQVQGFHVYHGGAA